MVETAGRLFQVLGLPRSTGQIYGLLYLSARPLSLDDLCQMLAMSKGSASTGTRHLASWRAIRQVWVPGDRRDYFEAIGDISDILRACYREFVLPRLTASERTLAGIIENLEIDASRDMLSKEEYKFCSERLRSLVRFQKKLQGLGPLAEKIIL
jgi:DNA-binding transcriptional regulator GbsR (MarR family)